MVISPKLKYAFVSTVKGGTNSLYELLTSRYEGIRYGDFHCVDVSQIPADWFLFTTCRNPFDRAVSIWWSTCMRGKDRYQFRQFCPDPDSFEAFCEWAADVQSILHRFTEPQQQLLIPQTARHGQIPFNTIMRMESLDEDFAALPFVTGANIEIPRLNPTLGQRERSAQYLTPRAIAAIRRWMKSDFERYGYSTEWTCPETSSKS
ncbi:MAG: sulfotransferase family 2 domain-containing protein, partial [Planctomycetaceae bacterium]|nr:sulfotransferase family 2 domain-containing protein [Planctomycetaceae bacterium]